MTTGVLDLTGYTSLGQRKDMLRWLRAHYVANGRDPATIRHDVLDWATALSLLTSFSYGDLLRLLAHRVGALAHDAALCVANDCDPDMFTIEDFDRRTLSAQVSNACLGRPQLTDRNFPRVGWPPFQLVSRVRNWSREELGATIRRGPACH